MRILSYPALLFLSALLLFMVQPLVGRVLLPWYGGVQAVWSACLLFFQAMLLLGYLYAHWAGSRLSLPGQLKVHTAFGAAAVLQVFVAIGIWRSPLLMTGQSGWTPGQWAGPVPELLFLLVLSVGLPVLFLAATSPLFQNWYFFDRNRSPFWLYAFSNLGSLLGLVLYPFFIDRFFGVSGQAWIWGGLFLFFGGASLIWIGRLTRNWKERPMPPTPRPNKEDAAVWNRFDGVVTFVMTFCSAALLLSVTSHITQEIAPVPFLWILPFVLYLLTFILTFADRRLYVRILYIPLGLALMMVSLTQHFPRLTSGLVNEIAFYCGALFALCMVCHGEVVRRQPGGRKTTSFYLLIAGGGVSGGFFVTVLAPRWFQTGYWELHFAFWLTFLMLSLILAQEAGRARKRILLPGFAAGLLALGGFVGWLFDASASLVKGQPFFLRYLYFGLAGIRDFVHSTLTTWLPVLPQWAAENWHYPMIGLFILAAILAGRKWLPMEGAFRMTIRAALLLFPFFLGAVLLQGIQASQKESLLASRNFYGVLRVMESSFPFSEAKRFELHHGETLHGMQHAGPEYRQIPTTYFTEKSGAGLALQFHPRRLRQETLRTGTIGLGVGTLAAYGQPGDIFRFYEINPEVIELAHGKGGYFSFLQDSAAEIEVVAGDGRISLQNELERLGEHSFDVILVDAFSSDSIPVHLLTMEAIELYLKNLDPLEGILAVHISNRYVDLAPVLWTVADRLGVSAGIVVSDATEPGANRARWILISPNPHWFETEPVAQLVELPTDSSPRTHIWTDQYSNLLALLDW